jgi:hypothetical protein
MIDHAPALALLFSTLPEHLSAAGHLPVLALQRSYGFWGPIISTLKGIGIAASGVGLMVSILIKGSAATNGDRHALAARVAQNVFAGLFLILLGWTIYDGIVAWTGI